MGGNNIRGVIISGYTDTTGDSRHAVKKPKTPVQDKTKSELEVLQAQKAALVRARDAFYDENVSTKIKKTDKDIKKRTRIGDCQKKRRVSENV